MKKLFLSRRSVDEKFPRDEKTFRCQDEVEEVATKKIRAMKKLFNPDVKLKERRRKISAR
jgi:hypothetical protein